MDILGYILAFIRCIERQLIPNIAAGKLASLAMKHSCLFIGKSSKLVHVADCQEGIIPMFVALNPENSHVIPPKSLVDGF